MNFFVKGSTHILQKLRVRGAIFATIGIVGMMVYGLSQKVEADTAIVFVDNQQIKIYAPDWEAEKVLEEAGVKLAELDRVQITKTQGNPIQFMVLRNAIRPEPPREMMVATSRGHMTYKMLHTMEATAYLPGDGDGRGITATGIKATWGVVAVDPKVIPLGSRVYVPGYGFAIAADTGGAIKGSKIDLCMEDYGQAIQIGRRPVEVYVL